ncbi:orotidine-5'-phosphate decarboxylase [Clostridium grantii]|uniref:Orotidine 5'-phosphate decarboxylase n=1 Tax=Clostridium grantii DSM 8605 TaxID=1121316 RepID=A0A1M5WBR9_9CLOT|nr:orotidine-5'-phosphate decarboxylase [Clostridium grantii]SHH84653.1 orotidine-5'-phosphate decarboxylase [Clostridium grantii DSM 8605]
MIIDKLYKAVEEKGHVCVGLDTDLDYIPKQFSDKFNSIEDKLFNFNKEIIDATEDVASCFKVQIAYYESYGIQGLLAYKRTLEYLREKNNIIIADVKRGDIAKTAEMYAKAHFTGEFESDFMTINPYMGMDSIEPFMPYLKNNEKGLFVLVRTSNKGASDFETIQNKEGKFVHDIVGEKIESLGKDAMGECGYSAIGGVIGCTEAEDGIRIRKELKNTFFLIPGYGAQGGGAKEAAIYLKDGNGGVVNSSRGILLAYKKVENGEENFALHARNEAIEMRDAIRKCSKERI